MSFFRSESGWVSVFSVIITAGCLFIMGIAIDVNNLVRAKTQLQVVADNAAHAALWTRLTNDVTTAKTVAVGLANSQMPSTKYGFVLESSDIEFGTWSIPDQVFTLDSTSKTAVLVSTERFEADGNGVATFLLRLVGHDTIDVQSESVFITYRPTCLREGFVAEDKVDMESNNVYSNGFCVHGNSHVDIKNDNTFEPGTIVSMPDQADIVVPDAGWVSNAGLTNALRDGYYNLRILNELPNIIDDLTVAGTTYTPYEPEDYITSSIVITPVPEMESGLLTLQPAHFTEGRVHVYNGCLPGESIYIHRNSGTNRPAGTSSSDSVNNTLSKVVFVTNCIVEFATADFTVEDAVIATTNTATQSVIGVNGLSLGKDDNCATGGGTQILTLGGFYTNSEMQMYGSQIIALDDVTFAAQANGFEGASIVSGGTIEGDSQNTFGFCGTGMENNYEMEYFRLAA